MFQNKVERVVFFSSFLSHFYFNRQIVAEVILKIIREGKCREFGTKRKNDLDVIGP